MAVKFLKVTNKQAETKIVDAINMALKKYGRVLWIVPGGSNIPLAVSIMNKLSATDSAKLAVMLTDERFGPVGHPDSNLQQLYDAGFQPKQATVVPVLRPEVPLDETTKLYGNAAKTAFDAADYSIGLFGMGADGHIAGILPNSPPTKPTKQWSMSYDAGQFSRVTLTPSAFSHLSEAFIVSFKQPEKRTALQNLQKKLSLALQPAQLLKKLPKLTVLNDQIGDKS